MVETKTKQAPPVQYVDENLRHLPLRGFFWIGVTMLLSFGLRMLEWPTWNDPEYHLGQEWLLATHDAYHWVAGAEGFSFGVGHPMSELLRIMAEFLHTYPAAVAFWFPAVLASFVAGIVAAWVWILGSLEAGVAAGLLTSLAPGFLARTLLGFYDTDLITILFPLLMTLAPAAWAIRLMLVPSMILKRIALCSGLRVAKKLFGASDSPHLGNPLRWPWLLALSLSGVLSWWSQEWHSVLPYLIRYNVALLFGLSICFAPRGRRSALLLGSLTYAFPALVGPWGLSLAALLLLSEGRSLRIKRFLCDWRILTLLWLGTGWLMIEGEILTTIINHANAYLKHTGDVRSDGDTSLTYPSVAQSIIEVQDLSLLAVLSYFHPWMEAALAGFLGFFLVIYLRPGALFLLPLAILGLLSTKLGGRMVMFGAPIVAIGLSLPIFWLLQRMLTTRLRGSIAGILVSIIISATLIAPFTDIIPAMSQGPMINRRHAEALSRIKTMAPEDAMIWIWWDWGYAEHHFGQRPAIADGAQHAGPSLYLPAAVFATDNPRFARQLIRYTSEKDNIPGNVFVGLDGQQAEALMERLRSEDTPLIKGKGRQFLVVSYEMLHLGFWISNYGSWNFATASSDAGALSILTQSLAYQLDEGLVQLEGSPTAIAPASINVFEETGVTCRNYVQEWFDANRDASVAEQQAFLHTRRNVNFFFNRVTGEKLAMDARLYNSLMAQLLLADPKDPRFTPYFKLVYDNVFARVYEVL